MANDLITPRATPMWEAGGANLKTLSVSPDAVGALMLLAQSDGGNVTTSAVSGGGCPASGSGTPGAWQRIAGPFSSAGPTKMEIWMGRVATAGASTLTITNTSTGTIRLNCKQFNAGGAGTVWSQDGVGGTRQNAASTTVTFPTLTPSGPNRLYIGFGTNGTGSASGMTAGYTVELDPGNNPYLYNASVPQSAQTPTSVTTSSTSYLIAALIKADNPDPARFLPFFV